MNLHSFSLSLLPPNCSIFSEPAKSIKFKTAERILRRSGISLLELNTKDGVLPLTPPPVDVDVDEEDEEAGAGVGSLSLLSITSLKIVCERDDRALCPVAATLRAFSARTRQEMKSLGVRRYSQRAPFNLNTVVELLDVEVVVEEEVVEEEVVEEEEEEGRGGKGTPIRGGISYCSNSKFWP